MKLEKINFFWIYKKLFAVIKKNLAFLTQLGSLMHHSKTPQTAISKTAVS
jgi:hypothetical protein